MRVAMMRQVLLWTLSVFHNIVCEDFVPVRLVNGDPDYEGCTGRVEVFYHGMWGTVCDYEWEYAEAAVVCKQLGCGAAVSAPGRAHFGEGQGRIWLESVHCAGSETSLLECGHAGIGVHWCEHYEDAGVVCEGFLRVRLVDPGRPPGCSGRVEVYHYGEWGTVCNRGWDYDDARVVCRQMGCGVALMATGDGGERAFGGADGKIWLYNVDCSGTEVSLLQCGHRGVGVHGCHHREDAVVVCQSLDFVPVRLMDAAPDYAGCSGRVEVFYYGRWGTVCSDQWGIRDAMVVCRQLGCGVAVTQPWPARFGECGDGDIWLDNVECTGSESSLTECRHRGIGVHDCAHHQDAKVVCASAGEDFVPVRLVDGDPDYPGCSGRVEVYFYGAWGTVCEHYWGYDNAVVVCRQLGCGVAVAAPWHAHFGEGEGEIWLDNVFCSGSESSLLDCSRGSVGAHDCGHHQDAGVVCESADFVPVRLVNGSSPTSSPVLDSGVKTPVRLVNGDPEFTGCSGRVEVFHFGKWGTVCDDNWDHDDAAVVCKQLGCGDQVEAFGEAYFGEGEGKIWLDDVDCSDSGHGHGHGHADEDEDHNDEESNLLACAHNGIGNHNCQHDEDAGVACYQ